MQYFIILTSNILVSYDYYCYLGNEYMTTHEGMILGVLGKSALVALGGEDFISVE